LQTFEAEYHCFVRIGRSERFFFEGAMNVPFSEN
jgi:hypothetical protein